MSAGAGCRAGRGSPGTRSAAGGCALVGWELAEAFDVDRDGGQDMLQVGLGLSPVAAVAHAVAAGELADGALDAGPHSVALVPGGVLLVGAVADLQLVELARGSPRCACRRRRWCRRPWRGRAGTGPW